MYITIIYQKYLFDLFFQILSATLLYYNRKYGMRASGVLFFFWFLLVLAGIPQLRSEIMAHSRLAEDENVQYNFVSYVIYYPLIVFMFLLNCFADLPPRDSPYKFDKVNNVFKHVFVFTVSRLIDYEIISRINVQKVQPASRAV